MEKSKMSPITQALLAVLLTFVIGYMINVAVGGSRYARTASPATWGDGPR
jgi:hypothetical protein